MNDLLRYHNKWTIIKSLIILKKHEHITEEFNKHFGGTYWYSSFGSENTQLVINIIEHLKECNYGLVLNEIEVLLSVIRRKLTKTNCYQTWDKLTITNNESIRFCQDCNKNVYLAQTEAEVIKRAKLGQCIALIRELEIYNEHTIASDKPFCKMKTYEELLGDICID